MQYKHFRIPCAAGSDEETALNTFLRSIQVLTVHRDFVADGANSFVLYSVEYLFPCGNQGKSSQKKGKIDYREVLSGKDFSLFARLREWRKNRAVKDGVAVYTIFTNEQLAQIAQKGPDSKAALQKIAGIGEAKINAHGRQVLELVASISENQIKPHGQGGHNQR